MGCGCAGVERAALTIAAPGGGAKILGPQGGDAVYCDGAALTLQGLAVECRGEGVAVGCTSKGRAELSGCTLTSPEGTGLFVGGGATATMDGGSISGCGQYGVVCRGSGATATVRPPCPLCCAPCPLRAAGAAAFLGPVSPFFHPFFFAVFSRIGTAVTQTSASLMPKE